MELDAGCAEQKEHVLLLCYVRVVVVVIMGKGRSAGEGGCRASLRDHSRLGAGCVGRGCWCGRFVKGGGRGFVLG